MAKKRVTQTTRRAVAAIDALERLQQGLTASTDKANKVSSGTLQDLRDAINTVKRIINKIANETEGGVRSKLDQEGSKKSQSQQRRFAQGPDCD